MRESDIENKVCAYAKSLGVLSYKFVSPCNRGVPDRIWLKDGRMLFVEFKSPKNTPTKLQHKVISNIRDQGFSVHIIDNVNDGKQLVDYFVK